MTKANHMIMLGQHLVTEKQQFFQPKRRVTKSRNRDDVHQITLIGLHVTQYMYVLLDKDHIYIQKSQFTLERYVQ